MTSRSTEVEFASSDGVNLFGTQVVPSAPAKALILFVHGITSDRAEWGVFDEASDVFAALGAASLRFDYRGHGESQIPTREITLAGIGRDIEAAWRELQNLGPDIRSYVIGSSFGGGIAYRAAATTGAFSRAFLLAPVFDYAQDIKKTAPNWKSDIKKTGFIQYSSLELSPEIVAEAESYQSIPASANLAATIFHGTKDEDVPISSSRTAAARHSWMELIEVEGAGHVIAAPGDLDMEEELSWKFVREVFAQMTTRMQLGA
jgi:uncharacterized protein